MTTLAEHIIVAGAENRPPMLEKSMYDSWESRIRLSIKGKKHGRMMLNSIDNATNIILHGLPPDVCALINHQEAAKDIWDKGKLLMKGTELSMTMQQVQVNTKFLDALPPERSKFVTYVKLANSLYTTNYDQLYAYLSQHEQHANEVCLMRERYSDPLALCFAGIGNKGIATTSRGNYAASQPRVVKCCNCQREGHMARQCTQLKRPRNYAWFKEKLMLVEEQEAAFQTEDLDAYDLNCDDISSTKAILMENLSICDSEVLFEVPYSDTYLNDMINQDVQEMTYSEQAHIVDFLDNEINKSKEKESKYIDEEIVLEKQNKELENILSLGYQNPFHLKKAQRIQPILYDGSVIAKNHDVISVIDDDETLILEEESRSKILDEQMI
ncbi:retrovirus-related pol polyprotein from transposon TNT 1-94 [Tanacetum coccineum]